MQNVNKASLDTSLVDGAKTTTEILDSFPCCLEGIASACNNMFAVIITIVHVCVIVTGQTHIKRCTSHSHWNATAWVYLTIPLSSTAVLVSAEHERPGICAAPAVTNVRNSITNTDIMHLNTQFLPPKRPHETSRATETLVFHTGYFDLLHIV